jgi:protein-disulfide isomerase
MACIVALIIFGIMGLFSATHRALAKEALDCVFRRVTFRPCNTGFKEKVKSGLVAWLLNRSVLAAKIFNKFYEVFAWIFFILMVGSTVWVVRGGYNFYFYGSCNGLNASGFCAFDPKGENNKVTSINATCGKETKTEATLSLEGVDLSDYAKIDNHSKKNIVFIGCYECEYSRKAYPIIMNLVNERKANLYFVHYPAKEETNLLSEVAYCVNREYPDKFWDFNNYLFTVDKVQIYEESYLKTIYKNFDFDYKRIDSCLKDKKVQALVANQVGELQTMGLYGTPTVFINGKAMVGPKPNRVYDWELIRLW